jgi:acyl carrier protein
MARIGILSSQLLVDRFINHFETVSPWNVSPELRALIVESFCSVTRPFAFSDDDSFQERGLVDSTGILELVCHLQEKYVIDIADDELVPDNLDSLSKVARFVQQKQQPQTVVAVAR